MCNMACYHSVLCCREPVTVSSSFKEASLYRICQKSRLLDFNLIFRQIFKLPEVLAIDPDICLLAAMTNTASWLNEVQEQRCSKSAKYFYLSFQSRF